MKPAPTPSRSVRKSIVPNFVSASRNARFPHVSERQKRVCPPSPTPCQNINNNNTSDDKNSLSVPPCDGACSASFVVPQTPFGKFKAPLACSTLMRTAKKPRKLSHTEDTSLFDDSFVCPDPSDKILRARILLKCMDESILEVKIEKEAGLSKLRKDFNKRKHEYTSLLAKKGAVRKLARDILVLDTSEKQLVQLLGNAILKSKDLVFDKLRQACNLLPLEALALKEEAINDECVCVKKNLLLQNMIDLEDGLLNINAGYTGHVNEEIVGKYRDMKEKIEEFSKRKDELQILLEELQVLALKVRSIDLAHDD